MKSLNDSIYQHTLYHPVSGSTPKVSFTKLEARSDSESVETAARLIAAYKSTVSQVDTPLKKITDTDLWTGITRNNFKPMLLSIENNNAKELSRFLTEFGSHYTWFGGVTTGVDGYNHWDTDDQSVAFSYFDKLICLAESMGILPAENPEQGASGNWGKNIYLEPDDVIDALNKHLSINIVPPTGAIPVAGLALKNGALHYRHINALYLASRLKDLTTPSDRICEYGAGLGLAAYYLKLMGRWDVTLFDIPITNVLSGFFLIRTLGGDSVCLEGEAMRVDAIKIRANWNCELIPDKHFKITANQDSFPEINHQIFDQYIHQIGRTTADYLLSINHEVEHNIVPGIEHLNVSRVLQKSANYVRFYRSPYWLRRGYVEELYKIK